MVTPRQRSTWLKPANGPSREAASSRRADIYTMNQEHPQPSPVEYESGSPDSWAETPAGNQLVESGYDGDHEARNDLNFVEFKPETFDHKDSKQWKGPGKYDNAKVSSSLRKAGAAERVARAVLRTADEKLVEEQAADLMALPDAVLASTLRRLDAVSPDALSKDRKYKRAMACCKFSSDALGRAATQAGVEKLGRVLMGLDDPTLKELLRTAATLRAAYTAAEEEEEGDKGKSAAPKADDGTGPVPAVSNEEMPPPDAGPTSGIETGCLSPQDMAMLDGLLHQEMGTPGAIPAPTGELTDLFEAPPPAAPAMSTPMPAMASEGPEITFGDDDDQQPEARTASGPEAGLDNLFSDLPDVVAQREIRAAEEEQKAREGGYRRTASVRGSDGAKRLGNVQGGRPASMDQELAALWDSPV